LPNVLPAKLGLSGKNFQFSAFFNQPNLARLDATKTGINETIDTGSNTLHSTVVPAEEPCLNADGDLSDCNPVTTQNRSIPPLFPVREVYYS
jgi:hypothetical protein